MAMCSVSCGTETFEYDMPALIAMARPPCPSFPEERGLYSTEYPLILICFVLGALTSWIHIMSGGVGDAAM